MLDHPVILIIVIAAALLRWLSQRSRAENQDDPERPTTPGKPIPRGGETQTEEERIRRFLEALGQPAGSRPPPKVAPKRVSKPSVFANPTLPPLTTVPPPLPVPPTPASPPPPPLPFQKVFTPAPVQEAGFEVRDLGAETSGDSVPRARSAVAGQRSLSLKLRSPQGLRDAIILREIFGPPRSLQALDPISGF